MMPKKLTLHANETYRGSKEPWYSDIFLVDEMGQRVATIDTQDGRLPEALRLSLGRTLVLDFNHARSCPLVEPRFKPSVVLHEDGRCNCKSDDQCPLGKTGSAARCLRQELERFGISCISMKDLQQAMNEGAGHLAGYDLGAGDDRTMITLTMHGPRSMLQKGQCPFCLSELPAKQADTPYANERLADLRRAHAIAYEGLSQRLDLTDRSNAKLLSERQELQARLGDCRAVLEQAKGECEALRMKIAAQDHALTLESSRLDWLDNNCSFTADPLYNIGPFKIGELRQMADAGLAVDNARPPGEEPLF